MVPSVHFLVRQAARERLAAVRTLSPESRQRHLAMADDYERRAAELGRLSSSATDAKVSHFGRKR